LPHVVDEDLTDLQLRVYAALQQAWNDFGLCPSQMQLQHACHCSQPVVLKAIRILKAKGYIIAPKFQVKAIRLTDPERTISNAPLKPWDELAPPKKYFVEDKRVNNRVR
jgi:hypothetical protein